MSTHAQIGVSHPDGTITGCYVHYDGYPEHMIDALKDYVSRHTTTGLTILIARAQCSGGIRSFNCHSVRPPRFLTADTRVTKMLDDNEPFIIDEHTWDDHGIGASYGYLVDYDTGEIKHETR